MGRERESYYSGFIIVCVTKVDDPMALEPEYSPSDGRKWTETESSPKEQNGLTWMEK